MYIEQTYSEWHSSNYDTELKIAIQNGKSIKYASDRLNGAYTQYTYSLYLHVYLCVSHSRARFV